MADKMCSVDSIPYSEVKKLDDRLQAFAPHSGIANFTIPARITEEEKGTFARVREDEKPVTTLFAKHKGTRILFRAQFSPLKPGSLQ